MAIFRKGLLAGVVTATAVTFWVAPAFATSIATPSTNPYTVPVDGAGNPVSFDVASVGWTPGEHVYEIICDGESPSTPGWTPTLDCDDATANGVAVADVNGDVTFPASSSALQVLPFRGVSPSGMFYCLAPADNPSATLTVTGNDPINPHAPSYTDCQLRLASSNLSVTSDQVFVTLTLQDGPAAQTPESALPVILPIAGVGVIGAAAGLVARRRRRADPAA
jgi:hypothetical protein